MDPNRLSLELFYDFVWIKIPVDCFQERHPQISKPGLQQMRLLQKVQSSRFYFWKQNLYVRFPGRKVNLFSDVTPVFGVTPAFFNYQKSLFTVHNLQKPDLLQDRLESWVVKYTTSLKFRSFRNNVGKQLARCCCPFYRSKAKFFQLPPSPYCHLVWESWPDGFTPPPRVSPSRAPVLSFAYYFQAPATQATPEGTYGWKI